MGQAREAGMVSLGPFLVFPNLPGAYLCSKMRTLPSQ